MTEWWRPTFQTTVDAFTQGDQVAGLEACERLLSLDSLPAGIGLRTRQNLVYYAPTLTELAPATTTAVIAFLVQPDWTRFNPSIAAHPDRPGFAMTVRSANFTLDWPSTYTVINGGEIIRTRNYLLDLRPELEIRDVHLIDDSAFRPEPPPFPVTGFEDCRLFHHRHSWWASAAVRDRGLGGKSRVALLQLNGAAVIAEHLISGESDKHEKNWMPVLDPEERQLHFVYSCYPTVLLRFDDAAHTVAEVITQPAPNIARQFRGGTQCVPFDGGHLCLIHEAVILDDDSRAYTHRWVWFDAKWKLAQLSRPFVFQSRGIEFAAGLARRGDDLVISYGRSDREALLAVVPIAQISPLLASPLEPEIVEADMRERLGNVATATKGPDAAADASLVQGNSSAARPIAVSSNAESLVVECESSTRTQSEPAVLAKEQGLLGSVEENPEQLVTRFPQTSPSIVSTTLSGNSQDVIANALRSVVDWVDWCLVIDTGISDDTLDIARGIAGDKLVVRGFPWREDFAAARNFALKTAAELGAGWAVTLDTDERLDLRGIDIRAALHGTTADTLYVLKQDGTYAKERFFRLPVRGRYVGPTHEAFERESDLETLRGIVFAELEKSDEQYRRKAERDVSILGRYTIEHPDGPRWFYYLGDSLSGLERYEEAVAAFRACASLDGWDEEAAWAMYRAGQSLLRLGRPQEAVMAYAEGMARHAGLAELPWMAAYASWEAGRPAQAAYWARVAVAMGHFAGAGPTVPRLSFRHPPGLWEGPYDVLRFALRELGDDTGANEAERLYKEAKAARERRNRDPQVIQQASVGDDHATNDTSRRRFADDYLARHKEIQGWLDDTAARVTARLLERQAALSLRGNVLEIGVHYGRYFLVLATGLVEGETGVAVDLFDDQHLNVTQSGRADWSIFHSNLAQFAPHARVDVVQADSTQLGDDFIERYSGMRFISIDGGHDRATASSDLRLAERLARSGAIVALDDIYRPDWSGVTAGLARYFEDGGTLIPFAFIPNKLLLTTDAEWASRYKSILQDDFADSLSRDHPCLELFNFDNLILIWS